MIYLIVGVVMIFLIIMFFKFKKYNRYADKFDEIYPDVKKDKNE